MKNNLLLLKKFACAAGIVLLMATGAEAQLLYSTDFSETYNGTTGETLLGGATPTLPLIQVTAGQWFGSTDNDGGLSENLVLDLETPAGGNKYRGSGVWLDTTGWAIGLVTVEVDVADYVAVGADKFLIFQAYAANGVDASNSVSLDLHAGFNAGPQLRSGGAGGSIGTATIAALGTEQGIDTSGTDVPFTFNFNGTDQYVGLTFAQRLKNGSDLDWTGTASLDDLSVTLSPGGLLGDFDLDGKVDLDDLDQYIGNIDAAATGALEVLDLDEDGTVGANDFAQHYTDLVATSNGGTGTFAGDANLDGVVDVLGDAAALVNNLGLTVTSWSQGDFNGDGTVDVLNDAAALIDNLGNTNAGAGAPATAAVPEPGCLTLVALTGVGAASRRRR